MRKALHKNIDNYYFDIIDEQIKIKCNTGLQTFKSQNQGFKTINMQAYVDLMAKMDNLVAKN